MNFYPNPDGPAFATAFKAQHDILTAMGKLNPHSKTMDSNLSRRLFISRVLAEAIKVISAGWVMNSWSRTTHCLQHAELAVNNFSSKVP
jgi:hypothetical protein